MTVRWKPLLIMSGLFLVVAVVGVIAMALTWAPRSTDGVKRLARADRDARRYDKAAIRYKQVLQFDADRRTGVFFYRARDDDRALLAERIREIVKRLVVRLKNDALNDTGAVPELQKHELPARAFVIEPALECDALADAAF